MIFKTKRNVKFDTVFNVKKIRFSILVLRSFKTMNEKHQFPEILLCYFFIHNIFPPHHPFRFCIFSLPRTPFQSLFF